jgi:ribonuclease-3
MDNLTDSEQQLLDKLADEFDLSCKQNKEHYLAAFTHRSFANENNLDYDNERLEFLGDAVLEFISCNYLYGRFSEEREGRLSQIKSAAVNTTALARIARKLNLDRFLRLGRGEAQAERGNERELADVLEAFIAAIFLTCGYETVQEFILPHLIEGVEIYLEEGSKNYKGLLLEYVQRCDNLHPVYEVVNVTGPHHAPSHEVAVKIAGDIYGRGEGANKKAAEQAAARDALNKLKKEKVESFT